MASGTNLVLHIVLPAGLRLLDGSFLGSPVTVDITGPLSPFYASIDQVKITGGLGLRGIGDMTIAGEIYSTSIQADLECTNPPDVGSGNYNKFVTARNQWVTLTAARDLVSAVLGVRGMPGTHMLGNMQVSRLNGTQLDSISTHVARMTEQAKEYEPILRSAGTSTVRGRPLPMMAPKQLRDKEPSPSRRWLTTGAGANAMTEEFRSVTGGREPGMAAYVPSIYRPVVQVRPGLFIGQAYLPVQPLVI